MSPALPRLSRTIILPLVASTVLTLATVVLFLEVSEKVEHLAWLVLLLGTSSSVLFGLLLSRAERAREHALRLEAANLELAKTSAELQTAVSLAAARLHELEAANGELDAFTYSVSHDLRAPLRAIEGFARILTDEHQSELGPEGKRLLGIVLRNATNMRELIGDLLEFARLGRETLRYERLDMDRLISAVFEEEVAVASETHPVEAALEPVPEAWGDPRLLRQVWSNLLGNAVKYTRDKRPARIRVSGERQGNEVVYRVEDNGVGFDMRHADKLWGVFQRLHGPGEFEGTGVGLALVQRMVARHGGRVWAHGEVGRGATFCFALPTQALNMPDAPSSEG